MLKDPNHKTETPYELLSLGPNAGAAEVNVALPKFMKDKRNIPKLGRAQEAVKKLKDPKERVKIDIWFYGVAAGEHAAPAENLQPISFDGFGPSWIPLQRLFGDLYGGLERGMREITFSKMTFVDLKHYDSTSALLPPLDR